MKFWMKGVLALVAVAVFFVLHTLFLSSGLAPWWYVYVRETLAVSVFFLLSGYYVYLAFAENSTFYYYLVLANIFFVIAWIHLLKFLFFDNYAFGGLLC